MTTLGRWRRCQIGLPNVTIMSGVNRCTSVGQKYNELVEFADHLEMKFDAVAVWDDDDVYLPDLLATHAEILANRTWSNAVSIVSAYFQHRKSSMPLVAFHGSIAVRRDLLAKVLGSTLLARPSIRSICRC